MTNIQEGQVWRKLVPHDWVRVENIQDPTYPNYDGGMVGCSVTYFPPQLSGIQLRGGKCVFINGGWRKEITDHRYLLRAGWKRGESAWDPLYYHEK